MAFSSRGWRPSIFCSRNPVTGFAPRKSPCSLAWVYTPDMNAFTRCKVVLLMSSWSGISLRRRR